MPRPVAQILSKLSTKKFEEAQEDRILPLDAAVRCIKTLRPSLCHKLTLATTRLFSTIF
jgi:hypothetical protein